MAQTVKDLPAMWEMYITHIGYSGVFGRFYLKEGEYKPTCGHYYNDENTAWSVNPKQIYSF